MKRIYYLTRSLSSVLGISNDLHQAGIGDNRIHVMGNNRGVLEEAHVHTTTVLEETDIMYFGFWGAAWGAMAGLLFGLVLAGIDPWGVELGSGAVMASGLFGGCFGAWLGGIRGISSRNHHLQPYMSRVENNGEYLVMVDADNDLMARQIQTVMSGQHREARVAGQEDHYSPFF